MGKSETFPVPMQEMETKFPGRIFFFYDNKLHIWDKRPGFLSHFIVPNKLQI
jgi:hypothetical protein